jgi:hypothetical protein
LQLQRGPPHALTTLRRPLATHPLEGRTAMFKTISQPVPPAPDDGVVAITSRATLVIVCYACCGDPRLRPVCKRARAPALTRTRGVRHDPRPGAGAGGPEAGRPV